MDHRECWTCKKMLHKSEYYKEDIVKYFNCKVCERARLSKLRDAARYCEVDGRCCFCCPRCHKAVDMSKVEIYGAYSFYTCTCKAEIRFRLSKKINERTGHYYYPPTFRCELSLEYGCRNICCYKAKHTAEPVKSANEPKVEERKVPKLVIRFDKK
jgi:hypothetical protein